MWYSYRSKVSTSNLDYTPKLPSEPPGECEVQQVTDTVLLPKVQPRLKMLITARKHTSWSVFLFYVND